MELLARFELATVLPRNAFRGSPYDLAIEIDEVASSVKYTKKELPSRFGIEVLLELLARFELATSSLPRVEGLRPSVVALPTVPKPCYINGFSFLYVDKASPFYAGMSLSLTLIIL